MFANIIKAMLQWQTLSHIKKGIKHKLLEGMITLLCYTFYFPYIPFYLYHINQPMHIIWNWSVDCRRLFCCFCVSLLSGTLNWVYDFWLCTSVWIAIYIAHAVPNRNKLILNRPFLWLSDTVAKQGKQTEN